MKRGSANPRSAKIKIEQVVIITFQINRKLIKRKFKSLE